MKTYLVRRFYAGILCFGLASAAQAQAPVQVDNLLRGESQVAEGVEIIVSVIDIGPGFTLPRHYHPGEEFVYVLEGEATLWQEGKPDVRLRAGEVYKIPLEQVHTAMTGDSATRAIVFRVHRKGEPDRVPVE